MLLRLETYLEEIISLIDYNSKLVEYIYKNLLSIITLIETTRFRIILRGN